MVSGRPGPILLDVPMDVLADSAEVLLPDPAQREARGRVRPAADDVERAAALLRDAKRPVIVAGGGAIMAEASAEITALAERLGAPVVTTWNGKGAIDETHELAGLTIGDTASIVGQRAVVHGRRAPLGRQPLHRLVGVLVPGRRDLRDPADEAHPARHRSARDRQELPGRGRARRRREGRPGRTSWRRWDPVAVARSTRDTDYAREIAKRKAAWFEQVEIKSGSTATPMTMARAVREIQTATRDDAIVVTGAGLPQGMVKQRWVTRAAADPPHVGRLLDDGLRASRRDRRAAGDARATGPLDLRRRRASCSRCRSSRRRSWPAPRSARSSSTTRAGSASRAARRRSSGVRPGPIS